MSKKDLLIIKSNMSENYVRIFIFLNKKSVFHRLFLRFKDFILYLRSELS